MNNRLIAYKDKYFKQKLPNFIQYTDSIQIKKILKENIEKNAFVFGLSISKIIYRPFYEKKLKILDGNDYGFLKFVLKKEKKICNSDLDYKE